MQQAFAQFSSTQLVGSDSISSANCVSSADMDNDGDQDVIYGGEAGVSWFENGSTRSFKEHKISQKSCLDLEPVDIDGDGDLDVICGLENSGIVLLLNTGGQNFTALPIGNFNKDFSTVMTADIDDDNDLDIVAGGAQHHIIWIENTGGLNFVIHELTTGGSSVGHMNTVYPVDMDGDNDMDLFVSDVHFLQKWYENDGNQNFSLRVISSLNFAITAAIPTDFDNDSDIDIVVGGNQELGWYENDSNQTFTLHQLPNTSGATNLILADLDNDGDTDLYTGNQVIVGDLDALVWYENNGALNFTRSVVENTWDHAYGVGVADLDGDTDLELIACWHFGDITWYDNLTTSLDINELEGSQEIKVYRAGEDLVLQWDQDMTDDYIEFVIQDLSGRVVFESNHKLKDEQFVINTSGWKPSVYILSWRSKSKMSSMKLPGFINP